jgi:hypothetical protein
LSDTVKKEIPAVVYADLSLQNLLSYTKIPLKSRNGTTSNLLNNKSQNSSLLSDPNSNNVELRDFASAAKITEPLVNQLTSEALQNFQKEPCLDSKVRKVSPFLQSLSSTKPGKLTEKNTRLTQ